MAISTVNLNVLDVGQGSGVFLESCDASNNVLSAVIVDLGSEMEKDAAGLESVKWIASRLKTMATPTLDGIFLSHSDSDHINLLDDLLDRFPNAGSDLVVKRILYGGQYARYSKDDENVLARLKKYLPSGKKLESFSDAGTSYFDSSAATSPVLSIAGAMDIYVLAVNIVRPGVDIANLKKGDAVIDKSKINTASMVVNVDINGFCYLLTGDATGSTLAYCNRVMASYTNFWQNQLHASLQMLSMPHHGSITTTLNITGVKRSSSDSGIPRLEMAKKNFQHFADYTKPISITCSAERKASFYHPSAYLFQFFTAYINGEPMYVDAKSTIAKGHFYLAFFSTDDEYQCKKGATIVGWPTAGYNFWYTAQTSSNIYTNLYYSTKVTNTGISGVPATKMIVIPPSPGTVTTLPASVPPLGVSWQYSYSKSTGKVTLTSFENRDKSVAPHGYQSVAIPPSVPPHTAALTSQSQPLCQGFFSAPPLAQPAYLMPGLGARL